MDTGAMEKGGFDAVSEVAYHPEETETLPPAAEMVRRPLAGISSAPIF